ncbi:MAG: hypothetical protein ACODAQ_13125 [Phycisphaeraceae bacterium]
MGGSPAAVVVCHTPVRTTIGVLFNHPRPGAQRVPPDAHPWARTPEQVINRGRIIAEQLLAQPPADRPDALIIPEDHTAMGLVNRLGAAAGAYRPQIVVQVNRQAPMYFSLPVVRYEIDIAEMAEQTAKRLHQCVLDPSTATGIWRYVPRRVESQDSPYASSSAALPAV